MEGWQKPTLETIKGGLSPSFNTHHFGEKKK
jgi:hypothetical protein